ncbi:hypothetical protein O159_11230 [Leifsonia xyli subsp. cynodontis DSM 46306]|uniref:Uncharacterized protein n=1 Tax=Leifsonia xyli subsp. cynodontis DSM 46306 TaxID=1389489 RepID=U3P5Y5_LEIXC|nr:hypothetical protein O159_11230 [Leifsonia xyli subsp. cynodontis DSM 46306]
MTSEVRKKYPTPLDLAKARADCLNDKGWNVTVDDDAQIHASYPSAKDAGYQKDSHACLLKLGIDPDAPTPDSVVSAMYPLYEKGAACLIAHGWPISEAPSLQVFKDTYETNPWFPWGEVPTGSLADALKLCPQPKPTY